MDAQFSNDKISQDFPIPKPTSLWVEQNAKGRMGSCTKSDLINHDYLRTVTIERI